MELNNIGFIGLGLIGGSIAKAIRETYPNTKIFAHTSHIETIKSAYASGVIDNKDFLPLSDFGALNVIFLCSPVKVNLSYLEELKPFLRETTILTDVGSVKGDIHKKIASLGLSSQFIGGHPMTGSEKIGFEHSSSLLLENAYYILTKEEATNDAIYGEFFEYIKSLKAIPLSMTPEKHDFATAAISHFPHVLSAALVNLVQGNETEDLTLKTIAAGGFKDITRISSSSPVMWQNICLENKEEVLNLMELFQEELSDFKNAIATGDEEQLLKLFAGAKDYRDSLPIRKNGMLPVSYELFLDIKDETGMIAAVATLLAKEKINIKNIGIINNREYISGALHIEVEDFDSLTQAKDVLVKNGYHIFTTN